MAKRTPKKKATRKKAASATSRPKAVHYDWKDSGIVDKVSEALARRWTMTDIRTMVNVDAGKQVGKYDTNLERFYHKVTSKVFAEIVKEARDMLRERLKLDKPYSKSLAIEFYEAIIRDPEATYQEKMKAQERIDHILGHDAKYQTSSESADELARKMRDALLAMAKTPEGE